MWATHRNVSQWKLPNISHIISHWLNLCHSSKSILNFREGENIFNLCFKNWVLRSFSVVKEIEVTKYTSDISENAILRLLFPYLIPLRNNFTLNFTIQCQHRFYHTTCIGLWNMVSRLRTISLCSLFICISIKVTL